MAFGRNRLAYGLLWARYASVERVLTFDPVVALNASCARSGRKSRVAPDAESVDGHARQ